MDEHRGLIAKVKMANSFLNRILNDKGYVTNVDVYSVVTKSMRETGRIRILRLGAVKQRDDNSIAFVEIKEAV